jgi:hypothetical protein
LVILEMYTYSPVQRSRQLVCHVKQGKARFSLTLTLLSAKEYVRLQDLTRKYTRSRSRKKQALVATGTPHRTQAQILRVDLPDQNDDNDDPEEF